MGPSPLEVPRGGESQFIAKGIGDVLQSPVALHQVQTQPDDYPAIPFPDAIGRLEETGVSGLDLCGNGIVIVKGELLVVRSGLPNRFPRSEPIRNVYRGDSSLVGRAFFPSPSTRPSAKSSSRSN